MQRRAIQGRAMERRDFLGWMGIGWLASCLPVAIAACTPQASQTTESASSPANTPAPAPGGFQTIGTVAELDQKGFLLNEKGFAQPVAVVRDASGNPSAVNPTCTHSGCTVAWKAEQKAFVCPCHDANFAPDGKVQKAPATKDLSTYEVKIEGDSVLVKLG
jgi:cytochrome b6-f complex iron-sulfur subunit